MTILRESTVASTNSYNSTGARTRANTTSVVYRLAGKNYPNLPISCDGFTSSESFAELLKCFHSLHATTQSVVFPAIAYASTGSAYNYSFACGIDFEQPGYSHAMMSGEDTQSYNTFLELKHDASNVALVVENYAFYDQILEINTQSGEVMVSR